MPGIELQQEVVSRRTRSFYYLFVILAVITYAFEHIPWTSSRLWHSLIETTSGMTALTVGVIALVRYYSKKSLTNLFIGTGFLGTAILNFYHTIVTLDPIIKTMPSGVQEVFIWSWTAERLFLASFLVFSWLFWKYESRFIDIKKVENVETLVYVSAPIFMIVIFLGGYFVHLPSPYFMVMGITRPGDALAGALFVLALFGYLTKGTWKKDEIEYWLILSIIFSIFVQYSMATSLHVNDMKFNNAHIYKDLSNFSMFIGLMIGIYRLFKDSELLNINLKEAKKELEQYSENLEHTVAERTADIAIKNKALESTIQELKSTQSRLVTQEKLASLGALTAGIAHELKNPLNFVNNFSVLALRNETSIEKIMEKYKEHYDEKDQTSITKLFKTIKDNLETVTTQGKRADVIIKRMLEHSRSENETPVPTDINALLEEYINLAYHGMRAQDTSFNATIVKNFDLSVNKLDLIAGDMSRVFLNLLSNAFYSLAQKKKQSDESYSPTLTVTSKVDGGNFVISFHDNGTGIPEYLLSKLFTPFFTTRPVGQGTGLGLSISHEIVAQEHQGTLTVETKDGEYADFIIKLPLEKLNAVRINP